MQARTSTCLRQRENDVPIFNCPIYADKLYFPCARKEKPSLCCAYGGIGIWKAHMLPSPVHEQSYVWPVSSRIWSDMDWIHRACLSPFPPWFLSWAREAFQVRFLLSFDFGFLCMHGFSSHLSGSCISPLSMPIFTPPVSFFRHGRPCAIILSI